MIRNRWVMLGGGAVLAVAILVALGFGVHAYAESSAASDAALSASTTGNYCQQYEQALARQLGSNTTQLQNANKAATQAVLDQMVKDGKITSAQEQRIEARLAKQNYQLCEAGAMHGRGPGRGIPRGLASPAARSAIESAVAKAIGISQQTLESDLANGQTLAQIAGSKLSAAQAAYLSAVNQQLTNAVSANKITAAQQTAIYTQIKTAVSHGHYPGLGHQHGMHGNPPAAPNSSSATNS